VVKKPDPFFDPDQIANTPWDTLFPGQSPFSS